MGEEMWHWLRRMMGHHDTHTKSAPVDDMVAESAGRAREVSTEVARLRRGLREISGHDYPLAELVDRISKNQTGEQTRK